MGHLNDSLLNLKEEEINFDDQAPLSSWEDQIGFSNSMREEYNSLLDIWNSDTTANYKSHPLNTFPFTFAEMSLFNKDGEVKIGDTILKVSADKYVEFRDGDITKLNSYNNGNTSYLTDTTIYYNFTEGKKDTCRRWVDSSFAEHLENNTYEIIMYFRFHKYWWKAVSRVQIFSKKWKSSRKKYVPYRTSLKVTNQSYFKDVDDCSTNVFSQYKSKGPKERKNLKAVNTHWAKFPPDRARVNVSVYESFQYHGTSNSGFLTWDLE